MSETNRYHRISDLKTMITEHIRHTPVDDFPQVLIFKEDLMEPEYTITIEAKQSDFFIDANGVKWKKVDELVKSLHPVDNDCEGL